MLINQQYLSKGFYQYAQIGNAVSVKNYIFMHENGKKCLLIRFSNDLEYTVDTMTFTVIQLDSVGKVITQTNVTYTELQFLPGSTYVAPIGLVVDDSCTDFKVVFSSVKSGRYEYLTRGGHLIVRYIRNAEEIVLNEPHSKPIVKNTVKPRRFGKPRLAAFLAAIAIIAMLAFNVYTAYTDYQESQSNRVNRIELTQSNIFQ